MNCLFRLALFLLPFDNLFFAPSSGWATITPIIFFIYILFNYKYLFIEFRKYKFLMLLFFYFIFISIIDYALVGFNLSALMDTLYSLILGLCSLFSIDIYFSQKNNDIKRPIKILTCAYTISLIYGWVQFVTLKFNISLLYSLFSIIAKRNYMKTGRIQFTFTEPSFIGMHLFGVLLPIYFISKNKKILKLIIYFILSALIFNSSIRFLLDTFIVFSIVFFTKNLIKKKKLILTTLILILTIFIISNVYKTNYRVKTILDKGIYSDNSLASRFFRINASIHGYKYNKINFFIGYGLGNASIPLKKGYYEALSEYKNTYISEIKNLILPGYYDSSASFCLYIRLISEYGIFTFILLVFYIRSIYHKSCFTFKLEYLLIICYLYLQFDSYAFYALWMFIFFMINFKNNLKSKGAKYENSTDKYLS